MLEVLLSNAIWGIIIGILTSCPMGPVGVLCVRRTLYRNREAGILTGLGASLSDVTYATAVYLGVGLVIGFIERYELYLMILGSFLILVFGLFLYLSPPNCDTRDSEQNRFRGGWQTFLSSYALTLSNPLIVFVFIAFFGRSAFVHEAPYYWLVFIYSMFFIFLGGLIWWVLLTFIVSKFRERISIGSVRIFNRLVALVFMAVAVAGVVSGVAKLL